MHREAHSTHKLAALESQLSVTVLIPAAHFPLFRRRLNQSGVRPGIYFRAVVQQATRMRVSRKSRESARVRSLYQNRGLNLVRFHLRVDAATWFELSLLARSAGESRCRYFWQLAFLDCISGEEDARLRGANPPARILWSITLTESLFGSTGLLDRRLVIRPPPIHSSN